MAEEPLRLLTIAGSDSGGAAGLQADLKTWTVLGAYGMCAITAVTAQNSVDVAAVRFMSTQLLGAQLEAVFHDYGAVAVKTGFIGSVSLMKAAAKKLRAFKPAYIVVDPVLVNHKGKPMFAPEVVSAYRELLLPLADIITPNQEEAALMAGMSSTDLQEMDGRSKAGQLLLNAGAQNVLITGLARNGGMFDWWTDGIREQAFLTQRLETSNLHGSGDTLSAAICAYLARGNTVVGSIIAAQKFTFNAIDRAKGWKLGKGHGPLSHFVS